MTNRNFLITLMMLAVWMTSAISATAQTEDEPVVHGVLFWSETCPHCHYVITEVLPPLQEQYGDQFDLLMIELNSDASAELFYVAGAAAGLTPEELGVPMLIIGDYLLMGSSQIPAELPGLIGQYLAEGGVDLPPLPGLEQFTTVSDANQAGSSTLAEAGDTAESPDESAIVEATPFETALRESEQGISGSIPAFIVLLGLVLAIFYAGIMLLLVRNGNVSTPRDSRLEWTIPILAFIGLVVATYLAYVETQSVEAVCGPVGDCNTVQSSIYATLFGVPIGVIGVVGYLAILAVWYWGRSGNTTARVLLLAMTTFGAIFSIYLTYLELFVIEAVCMWCLTSAATAMLLVLAAARWLAATWSPPAALHGRPAA